MAVPPRELSRLKRLRERVAAWADGDDYAVAKVVLGITLLSVALRVVGLGSRVAHYDEGRVAYWALNLAETGSFTYRYIIHGPFIQHVDAWLFSLLGTSDLIMRLPVALVGGLLPVTALLFREHLRREEIVGVAAFLALNPLLLYYSRFMRSDVLVAAFMFTAFGLLVRFYDTRKARYLYGVGAFAALGFASKENAIVYVVTWFGATGLLLAKVLVLPNGYRDAASFLASVPSPSAIWNRMAGRVRADVALVVETVRSFRERHGTPWQVVVAYVGHVGIGLAIFLAVSLFFYAPRGAGLAGIQHPPATPTADSVNFWNGVTNPAMFPELVQVTSDRVIEQYSNWFNPASERATTTGESTFQERFDRFYKEVDGHYGILLEALAYTCGPLVAFSAFGYALDRLGSIRPRHLVPFAAYCGYVSIVGYPIGTDIGNPWIGAHVVVPLAIPAGVGVAAIFRWGVEALSADDVTGVATSALVLVLVTALVGNVAATTVYSNAHEESNPLVQFAQPQEELRSDLTAMERIARDNQGTDVVVYYGESGDNFDDGSAYVQENRDEWGEAFWNLRPTCLKWYNTLPLPWYFASGEMETVCENDREQLSRMVSDEQPPIVITQPFDGTQPGKQLGPAGYERRTHQLRTGGYKNTFTVWIHESHTDQRPS
ncbi:flippase activity-associated protein Agl23 [Haloarcula halophila]|uniref:flippase activity-associated protein Agl23 n=1 Tax=Haloarcula TaxID=2237 RepID=UPI0023E37B17|nr:flippase activity-associated protein Agl23 [Halomicroarcula sp. DFY41]